MKIGITVPNNWGVEDVHDVVALGQQAEQLGFDSIWTMDHLLNIGFVRDRLDNKPYFHPLGILSFLAARTTSDHAWYVGDGAAISQPHRAGEVLGDARSAVWRALHPGRWRRWHARGV